MRFLQVLIQNANITKIPKNIGFALKK
jgi:hypothetical protein